MSTPIHSSSTGDIWQLSADDLLAPLPTAVPRLGGAGPFVINLAASSAPITPQALTIAGCEQAQLYQIQRTEDRRIRFRLRFGPFASEDEVDTIIDRVRAIYPSALAATADTDDLRVIAALQARAQSSKSPAHRPLEPRPSTPVRASTPVPAPGPAPAPAAARASAPARAPAPSPAHATARVAAPARAPVPSPAAAPSAAVASSPAFASTQTSERVHGPAMRRSPSTDAVEADRVLTQLDAREESAMGWFVIQLLLADEAIEVDQVPKHDIFKAYRLYSVAGLDQGRVMHALRLGFFKEQSAAQAVANYLAAFYESPSVKRVNATERDRFADRRVDPRRDVGPGGYAVIEITGDRFARPKSTERSASAKTR